MRLLRNSQPAKSQNHPPRRVQRPLRRTRSRRKVLLSVTKESEGQASPNAPALSPPNAVAQQKAPSEQLIRPVEEPIASPPSVPPTAGGDGPAATKAAAYVAQARAKIQQGDIAAARRLLERASDSD